MQLKIIPLIVGIQLMATVALGQTINESIEVSLLNPDSGKYATAYQTTGDYYMYNGDSYSDLSARTKQNWKMEYLRDGDEIFIQFRSISTGQCLRIFDELKNGSYPIRGFTCDGAKHNHWRIQPVKNSSAIVLQNRLRDAYCLEATGGTGLAARSCGSSYGQWRRQLWAITPPRPTQPN